MNREQQDFTWREALAAIGDTDAGLRRKIQRPENKISIDLPPVNDRLRFTIWDVARLAITRGLVDFGLDTERAFAFAKFATKAAYGRLIEGKEKFSSKSGSAQIFYYFFFIGGRGYAAPGIVVKIDPRSSHEKKAESKRELLLQIAEHAIVLPIHQVITEAWRRLPNLPPEIDSWMTAAKDELDAVLAESGKHGDA